MFKRKSYIAIVAAVALGVYGCSIDGPTAPPSEASNNLIGGLVNGLTGTLNGLLMRCDEQEYRSATRTIGRSGGRIDVGPHSLVIPAGALKSDTRITAEVISDRYNTLRFSPHGLKFAKPVNLTMSYAHCRQLLPLPIQIVYTSEELKILELLGSNDDRRARRVSAPIDHFSRYATSWRGGDDDDDNDSDGDEDGGRRGRRRGGDVY